MVTMIDTALVTHNGVTLRVDIEPDPYTDPNEADPDGDPDLRGFGHDWHYVMVTITPVRDGWLVDDASIQITGVAYGDTYGWTVTTADVLQRAGEDGWYDQAISNLGRAKAM